MNKDFISVKKDEDDKKILKIMRQKKVNQIPVLDESGKILSLKLIINN